MQWKWFKCTEAMSWLCNSLAGMIFCRSIVCSGLCLLLWCLNTSVNTGEKTHFSKANVPFYVRRWTNYLYVWLFIFTCTLRATLTTTYIDHSDAHIPLKSGIVHWVCYLISVKWAVLYGLTTISDQNDNYNCWPAELMATIPITTNCLNSHLGSFPFP